MKDEVCASNIWISELVITEKTTHTFFNGKLKNNSSEEIKNQFINIFFTKDNKEIKVWYYIGSISPEDELLLNVGFPDNKAIDSTSYRIESPSQEEIIKYQKLLKEQTSSYGWD